MDSEDKFISDDIPDSDDQVEEIAIIGIAGRFPGANNINEFWDNITSGTCSIKTFNDEECRASGVPEKWLTDPEYVRRQGVLENPDLFAADFFSYTPKEAELIDPQQRLFLECSWEALEDAGYVPDAVRQSVGVFAASGLNYYLLKNVANTEMYIEDAINVLSFIGSEKDFISTRVSYKLNLTGPSMCVQSACSSSLVAVHLACQNLLSYQCDMALSGGVSLQTPRAYGYRYREGEIFSPDGDLRAFDAKANGTLFGEGVGIVVLKRLSEALYDRDHIYAVIKSTAVNNDGSQKIGFTAPGISGQSEVIDLALNIADVEPDSISYIEAHGTGTQLGDPVEVKALTRAYRKSTTHKNYCALGSVKSNIGHLDVAAGITGLIKTALCLKHNTLVPQINYTEPNPELHLEETPFYINTKRTEWPVNNKLPRRAGVSSFGLGGTNSHAVLEEAPGTGTASQHRPYSLFTFSAKSRESLLNTLERFFLFFKTKPDIIHSDAAFTLATGRKELPYRYSFAGRTIDEIIEELQPANVQTNTSMDAPFQAQNIVFLFPGQGSQYYNMAHELYKNESIFKDRIDECARIINQKAGIDILNIIFNYENDELLGQTRFVQPALFTIEYSLAQYLIYLGIKPTAVTGHSLGEITAACISGVFTLTDALEFIIARGEAMHNAPAGKMLAATLNEKQAQKYCSDTIFISAVNSEQQTIFSGIADDIKKLETRLKNDGLKATLLKNNNPFHSELMRPVIHDIHTILKSITLQKPDVPLVSNINGDWVQNDEMTSVSYWEEQIVNPVRFKQVSDTLLSLPGCLFIEIGPGNVLSSIIKNNPGFSENHRSIFTLPHPKQKIPDLLFFLKALGRIWGNGLSIDWSNFYQNEKHYRIPLPTTAFDRQHYWVSEFAEKKSIPVHNSNVDTKHVEQRIPNTVLYDTVDQSTKDTTDTITAIWKEIMGYTIINDTDNFFEIGGNSLIAAQIVSRINKTLSTDLTVSSIFDNPSVKSLSHYLNSNKNLTLQTMHVPIAAKANSNTPQPLTLAQKRLWFFHEFNPASPVYNLAQTLLVTGMVNFDALKQSLTYILKRHDIFRTNFNNVNGEPFAVFNDKTIINIFVRDYSRFSPKERENKIHENIIQTVRTPIDFEKSPIYKIILYKENPERYYLVLFIPHIITDGWSFNIFQNELEQAYLNIIDGKGIEIKTKSTKYLDYAIWQYEQYLQKDINQQINFWKNYLGPSIPILQLPTDYDRPVNMNGDGDTCFFQLINEELLSKIQKLTAAYNVTNFMFVMAAINILLHRYSGQESVIIGIPYANRDHEQIEDTIGFFLNMLPIRTDFTSDLTVIKLIKNLMSDFKLVVNNNDTNFERLVEELKIERYQNINPVFQVMVAYQNYLKTSTRDRGIQFKQVLSNRGISEYDISFYLWEEDHTILGALEYSSELFKKTTIIRMIKHLQIVIEASINNIHSLIDKIDIITPEERERVVYKWNKTNKDFSQTPSLPELFYKISSMYHNKIAAKSETETLTYRLLNQKSNQLTRYLIKKGVHKGDLVGILLKRNLNMLISVLGILKAGAAYIPLDPDFPVPRLQLMIEDSHMPFIITQPELKDQIKTNNSVIEIMISSEWKKINNESNENVNISVEKDSLAYILYTSGSTGIPNGVQISHNALINFLLSMQKAPGITSTDTVLALTTLSFDISGLELFLPLISGATVEIITHEQTLDSQELKHIIKNKKISIMQATPATYQQLIESGWTGSKKLKILCGGEAMSRELANKLVSLAAEVWNMYGPTETTIWSSIFRLTVENHKPLLGKPISNTQFYVLDKNMKPVPVGIAGELYIAGAGLANGYLNRKELTEKRFIHNPFSTKNNTRMYKTGDMVRYTEDGNLEYLGRMDFQVKIRGYRIELEDIETIINKYNGAKQAVCTIMTLHEHDKRIIAYIRPDNRYNEAELRNNLKEKLPGYMVPNHYVTLEQFPLTPNGKIDRKALPEIDINILQQSVDYVAPKTETQKKIVKIWEQILEHEKIGIFDNFFDLGGHSLLATKLIHKMNNELGTRCKLRDIFSDPTIAGLSTTIQYSDSTHIPLLFPAQPNGDKTPLFLVAGVYDQFYYKQDESKSTYENDFLRYFNNLIVNLGTDRPIYGLRPRGIFLNEKFHKDVKGMAHEYINEIKKIQHTGPYLLGGECLGGIVAYEIAQQLMVQGDDVALCILMDTYRPNLRFEINYRIISTRQKIAKIIRQQLKQLKDEKLGYIKKVLFGLPELIVFYRKVLLPLTHRERQISRVHFGSSIYARKLIAYRPKPYKGQIALIINEEWNKPDPNLGWNTKYCQNITMKITPGNHTTRLTSFGNICGKTLKDFIEGAMSNH